MKRQQDYIEKHPYSKIQKLSTKIQELSKNIENILSLQHDVPESLDVYDVECDFREYIEDNRQKLTIKFRYKGDYVVCEQDMCFHDTEHKNVIVSFDQLLSIRFIYKEVELQYVSDDDKRLVFHWLHEFLLKRFQYDPFFTDYENTASVYQAHVRDFHEWLDKKHCELIEHLVCKSIFLHIQSFLHV
jgi:hypothetical protein